MTTIDPRLPPVPVKRVTYEERDIDDVVEVLEAIEVDTSESDVDYVFEQPEAPADVLDPPSSIAVISQTVKVSSAGTQTVDVIIEITDVPGAAEYERRDSV